MIDLKSTKIYADGANKKSILELDKNPLISGFTTNPTLMKKDLVIDYKSFALDVLNEIKTKPISFEVFADDMENMKRQALEIASWGKNVYVKIPITNTKDESTADLVNTLSHSGVKVNVTAVFTLKQVSLMTEALKGGEASVISVFAGRIADCGIDPVPVMIKALEKCMKTDEKIELLWASPRELLNISQAIDINCNIITVSHDLLAKLYLFGKDLEEYSLETCLMFYNDAKKAGYLL